MKRLTLLSLLLLACADDHSGRETSGSPSALGTPDGGTPTTGGANGVCQVTTVGTGRVAPEILIVLDRSSSMRVGNVNRWDPSVSGLKAITMRFQDRAQFGLMTFPGMATTTGMTGGAPPVDPAACFMLSDPQAILDCLTMAAGGIVGAAGAICGPGTLNVPIAGNNAAAIASALDGMAPLGATPTSATLLAAHMVLKASVMGPDEVAAGKYVLLVTDGAPNCVGGTNNMGDPAAVQASVAEIDAMTKDGIKTYVLGYGTQSDAALKDALDKMARVGGTGDTAHRTIEDQQTLITAFEQITGQLISCEFALEKPVFDKTFVKVLFDGTQVNVDSPNGWVLSADGTKVTLQGSACQLAKEGGHTVSVSVQCDPVPPLL